MKKIISLAIVLVLIVTAIPSQSFAADCRYATTQNFLNYLDNRGITYTLKGLDSDDDEVVTIEYTGNNKSSIETRWYFDNDPVRVEVKVWYVIKYSVKDYYYVLEAVNQINSDYRYVKFFADISDNSVTAQFDMPISANNAGEMCYDVLRRMINLIDDAYLSLRKYDTGS